MGLESGNTIASLNASWPLGSDKKSEGDDHLRLVKGVIKNDVVSKTAGGTFDAAVTVSGRLSGALSHSSGYLEVNAYSGSYDDGSVGRMWWNGNNKQMRFEHDAGADDLTISVGRFLTTNPLTTVLAGNCHIDTQGRLYKSTATGMTLEALLPILTKLVGAGILTQMDVDTLEAVLTAEPEEPEEPDAP